MWRLKFRANGGLAALLAGVVLAACGGGDDIAPAAPATASASATIGAAGGTLDGPDGSQVVIPAGALAQDTLITIAKRDIGAPAETPDGYTRSATYEFTPHDIAFAQPVTMRIPAQASAQAADQGVFRSGLNDGWQSLGEVAGNGFAQWQSASFSWYAYWDCAIPVPNPDPYPCAVPVGGTQIVSTPANALTLTSSYPQAANRFFRVRETTTLQLTANYLAAADCGDARIVFKRRRPGDARPVVLLDTAATVTPSGSNRLHATATHTVQLTDADNGSTILVSSFSCRRTYQPPSRANWTLAQQRTGAGDVMVFDALIPAAPTPVPPSVTQSPADQSVIVPAAATFAAAVGGTPLPTMQWQLSTDGGVAWSDIAGATGTSYTTAATTAADNGKRFRLVASNSAGTATSSAALLTVTVPAGPAPLIATSMATGYANSLVAAIDGTVWAWGYQIDPTTGGYKSAAPYATTPVRVQGLTGVRAVSVSAEANSFYALHDDGTVSAWGLNTNGQLGDRTVTAHALPVKVMQDAATPMGDVCAISASANVLVLTREAGSAGHCSGGGVAWIVGWLSNSLIGGDTSSPSPSNGAIAKAVPGLPAVGVRQIVSTHAANARGALLIELNDATWWAWGDNSSNVLGVGVSAPFAGTASGPVQVSSFWASSASTALGRNFALALQGASLYGVGGNGGNPVSSGTLQPIASLNNVSAFSAGQASAAAIMNGELWQWGWNGNINVVTPTRVGTATGFTLVSVGDIHSLAVGPGGEVYSWGDASFGALGRSGSASTPGVVMRP